MSSTSTASIYFITVLIMARALATTDLGTLSYYIVTKTIFAKAKYKISWNLWSIIYFSKTSIFSKHETSKKCDKLWAPLSFHFPQYKQLLSLEVTSTVTCTVVLEPGSLVWLWSSEVCPGRFRTVLESLKSKTQGTEIVAKRFFCNNHEWIGE